MIQFSPSLNDDIQQIVEWTAHDPYHFHQDQPEWWLTNADGSLLAFCLMDARGPLSYVRLDAEGEYVRIHTQFAPRAVVSRGRLVVGMIQAIKALTETYKQFGAKGLVFNSINPALVAFMEKNLEFKSVGNDDYRLDFEEQQ